MSSAERKKTLLDSLERSRNNTSIESNDGARRRRPENERRSKRSPEFDLLNVQALSRRRHNSNLTSDEVNSSLEYTDVNRPDIIDSLSRRRRILDAQKGKESELQKVALSELRRRSTESADSEDESSSPKHSRRNHWSGDSDSESEEVKSLVRRSSSQLEAAEALMNSHESSPDLLRAFDYVRTPFDTDFSIYTDADDEPCSSRRPACLRARFGLVFAAFSILIIVYIHLQ